MHSLVALFGEGKLLKPYEVRVRLYKQEHLVPGVGRWGGHTYSPSMWEVGGRRDGHLKLSSITRQV